VTYSYDDTLSGHCADILFGKVHCAMYLYSTDTVFFFFVEKNDRKHNFVLKINLCSFKSITCEALSYHLYKILNSYLLLERSVLHVRKCKCKATEYTFRGDKILYNS
jgi:hypothetical protein